MKAYEVNPSYQAHYVIADTIEDAARIYEEKYGKFSVHQIILKSDYVQVQGIDTEV